jgi:hypothetical protein
MAEEIKSASELVQQSIEALEAQLKERKEQLGTAILQDRFVEWLNSQDQKYDKAFKIRLEYKINKGFQIDYVMPTSKDGKGRIVYDWSIPTINGKHFPLKGEKSLDVDKCLELYSKIDASKFRASSSSIDRMALLKAIDDYKIVDA